MHERLREGSELHSHTDWPSKMRLRANALFLVTIVCGTILVVLLSIVLSSGPAQPEEVSSVMYFALCLGDGDGGEQYFGRNGTPESEDCSFYLNVNNTRRSIMAMQNLNQRYSYILYDECARSTVPLKALDAIARLASFKPIPGGTFNQTSAIGEFARHGTERDRLVYYFPCKYSYSDNLLRNANAINDADYEGKANCITFFAGVKSADEMGKLKPEKLGEPKRVVLVSLRGINLTTKVEQNGEAISVSRAYTTDHVSKVVDSILSSFRSHNFVYV
ncbi:hypothetical protein Y032_0193g1407 [Ancylostoma ceylanicum]|nr:hypothetical protein Y032_0193g1407 [Ancylostoma ceylanicum]